MVYPRHSPFLCTHEVSAVAVNSRLWHAAGPPLTWVCGLCLKGPSQLHCGDVVPNVLTLTFYLEPLQHLIGIWRQSVVQWKRVVRSTATTISTMCVWCFFMFFDPLSLPILEWLRGNLWGMPVLEGKHPGFLSADLQSLEPRNLGFAPALFAAVSRSTRLSLCSLWGRRAANKTWEDWMNCWTSKKLTKILGHLYLWYLPSS